MLSVIADVFLRVSHCWCGIAGHVQQTGYMVRKKAYSRNVQAAQRAGRLQTCSMLSDDAQ